MGKDWWKKPRYVAPLQSKHNANGEGLIAELGDYLLEMERKKVYLEEQVSKGWTQETWEGHLKKMDRKPDDRFLPDWSDELRRLEESMNFARSLIDRQEDVKSWIEDRLYGDHGPMEEDEEVSELIRTFAPDTEFYDFYRGEMISRLLQRIFGTYRD
jgi:hypothetical protein